MNFIRRSRVVTATIVVAVAVGVSAAFAVVAIHSRSASSTGGAEGAAVDFSKITPLPFTGYGTFTPPDYSNPPHCLLSENDRPDPALPPLSCRYTGAEPPAGAIATVDPSSRQSQQPASTPTAGYRTVDNQLFRFTVQLPDTWYSDMRPEGGAFFVSDPRSTRRRANGTSETGGVGIEFSARKYVTAAPLILPDAERMLTKPNTVFAGAPGVIWEVQDGGSEGLAVTIHAAFRKDDVLYETVALVLDDGQPASAIQADIVDIRRILESIAPY